MLAEQAHRASTQSHYTEPVHRASTQSKYTEPVHRASTQSQCKQGSLAKPCQPRPSQAKPKPQASSQTNKEIVTNLGGHRAWLGLLAWCYRAWLAWMPDWLHKCADWLICEGFRLAFVVDATICLFRQCMQAWLALPRRAGRACMACMACRASKVGIACIAIQWATFRKSQSPVG